MGIRSKNIESDNSYNEFAQKIISQPINVGASFNQIAVETRMPWAGKIISAVFRASTITDSNDSARVKVLVTGTIAHAAAVDPVADDTTTTFTLTTTTFAAGALLQGHVLTGTSDALVGTFTWVVRPYLGVTERLAASLGES